ncbi:MAG TPA: HlyD family efflux transporter periplasmic adaptor subunit [Desulfomonilaceae bacterium]|nr:HlyD family efflux transporter periplasmic adaptor subunit [Desulfomonilaceae bacterium]HVN77815.1 HlyD family efflux transporter periplasmic adaptor subunit [Terriglobia bacterium]
MISRKWLILAAAIVVVGVLAYSGWKFLRPAGLPEGFVSTNGRIEATEIDVAAKIAGRIAAEFVDEGDLVAAGQVVAQMDTDVLTAELREAEAKRRLAQSALATARSTVVQRESEKAAALSVVAQRKAELDVARQHLTRTESLVETGARPQEHLDDDRATFYSREAAFRASEANVAAADAGIATAKAAVIGSQAAIEATQATIERIQADINDSALKSPRDCRVQYRISQPAEVLNAGGKVLNLVDLSDVYMTFFLPTDTAGRVRVGTEARLILDAAPQYVIPASVTFIADVAQFTPKTVETAEERQKLTFRIKAHIPPELLKQHIRRVKTGLPGMAYVRLDPQSKWPANLEVRLPND